MLLNETLDALRAAMTDEAMAAFAEIQQRFDSYILKERVLKPGDLMPDFVLPNAEGKLISSAQLLSEGLLIISFYRGSWCRYCNVALQALDAMVRKLSPRVPITLLALSPETGGLARQFKTSCRLECEVLVDVDNAVAAQFGVVIRLPDRYQTILLEQGIDAKARHGDEGWLIPLASTFVVSREGRIAHGEVHVDHTRRSELENIPAVIAKLCANV